MSSLKSKGCLFLASSLCDGLEDNDIKQVTTLLLNTEANPNTLIPMHGVTPFHLVIGNDSETFAEEVTKLFLRHGGNPNVRSVDGLTPVHVAAAWGRVTVLELLLANGGDPLCLDEEGRTPFHYAFDGKYYKAIAVLGKYCDKTVKDKKSTNYKVTFDKLVINNGSFIAEYADVQIPDIIKESELDKNDVQRYNEKKSTDTCAKYFCDLDDNSLSSNDQSAIDAAKFRINEERNREKMLVNEIINKLSNSLTSSFQQQEVTNEHELTSEKNDYDTSPLSTISTDNSTMYNIRNQFLLKNRRQSITPKYRRKNFKQSNNTRTPLIPACNVDDYIISKSPNLVIGESFEKKQEYLSPKISQKELKFKTFTPCATRNQPFQSEFNTEKAIARSTPRRRKQFYRQYSSCRKLKKSNRLTSSENTSPDSASPDSLSPHHFYNKKPNYKLNKNLVIKLHESKYDDDVSVNFSSNENKENEKYEDSEALIGGLNNNFSNLKMDGINFAKRNEENLRGQIISPKNFPTEEVELKANNVLRSFKENASTFFSSSKSVSYITAQEEYKHEDLDEGMAFRERITYKISSRQLLDDTSTNNSWPSSLHLPRDEPLTNKVIHEKLINLGDNPGPVTHSTRQVYLKRLMKLENKNRVTEIYNSKEEFFDNADKSNRVLVKSYMSLERQFENLSIRSKEHCSEKYNSSPAQHNRVKGASKADCYEYNVSSFLRYGSWVNDLQMYKAMEKQIFEEYSAASPSRGWRGGINKDNFTYLLLDPRITNNLYMCADNLPEDTVWYEFFSAVFYIGKGKRNRPFSHLKDAYRAWVSRDDSDDAKIQHILDIWNEKYGVICLQVFQNCSTEEALTREAFMIDAIKVERLKNCINGTYYGKAKTWSMKEKRKFGRYLLYKAMQIYLNEGERQIFPYNLRT
nr:PREDICTED: uncharacterized protein LOC100879967 isoform X1 [Megachile rotundata]XP_012143343.1 PREDICTED: uncharacterized protein LOC100879967 isoform X1 [Megachile rotundata]XP_012143344.1 PREDICTED: uncharacterized protein LOC100879967 isoform X1 [Megachile rotundata]XP_012143345.1 PREDICTED: uncharacterized protein LOC100879967 isoform X1 [Megachile rotundata]